MTDDTKTPVERALEAVRADAALGRLEWTQRHNRGADMIEGADPGCAITMRIYCRADIFVCVWMNGANWTRGSVESAVRWAREQLRAHLAACRAVDPEYALVVEERDALRAQLLEGKQWWQDTHDRLLADIEHAQKSAGTSAAMAAQLPLVQRELEDTRRSLEVERRECVRLQRALEVANQRAETLRAQLAAAEERAARAWGFAQNGAVKCIHAAGEFWKKAAEERDAWRDDLHRFVGSLRGLEREVASLTPPEAPDA